MKMTEHVEELAKRKAKAAEMGGKERVERQRARNKLDARERLARLFDESRDRSVGPTRGGVRDGDGMPNDRDEVGFREERLEIAKPKTVGW